MAKLIVDLDVLQRTINTYNTEIENFEDARKGIITKEEYEKQK